MNLARDPLHAKVREYSSLHKVDYDEAFTQCASLYPELFNPAARKPVLGNTSPNGLHRIHHETKQRVDEELRTKATAAFKKQAAFESGPCVNPQRAYEHSRNIFSTVANEAPQPIPSQFDSAAARESLLLGKPGEDGSIEPGEYLAAANAAAPTMRAGGNPNYDVVFGALRSYHMNKSGLTFDQADKLVRSRHPAIAAKVTTADNTNYGNLPITYPTGTAPVSQTNTPLFTSAKARTDYAHKVTSGGAGALSNAATTSTLPPQPPRSYSDAEARRLGLSNAADQWLCHVACGANGGSTDSDDAKENRGKILNTLAGFVAGRNGNFDCEAARTSLLRDHPNLADN